MSESTDEDVSQALGDTETTSNTFPISLSARERAILILSVVSSLSLGVWLGLFLVPVEALADPITGEHHSHDGLTRNYLPIPTYLPPLTLLVLLGGAYFAAQQFSTGDDDE